MATITYEKFQEASGRAFIVLLSVMAFLILKFLKGSFTVEYILIFVISLSSFIALRFFYNLSKKMMENQNVRMSSFQVFALNLFLIIGLGILAIYIFAVKGVYGIYQLFYSFSWFLLILRLAIIIASVVLANAISIIQDVLKWLSNNTWTKVY